MSDNFIKNIIEEDIASGKNEARVFTRFPPEPNGYLHIGHAKAIWLNFSIAQTYKNAQCHLRFDDTNPTKEEEEYARAIEEDVRWLGYSWGDHLYHASDYFDQLYAYAVELIKKEKAFVCSLTAEETKQYRGTLTESGKESPYRNRSVEENLDLFERMKSGEFKDGEHVLRAKIDMSSGNINMRDPIIYRIKHADHPRTGDKWCIYPMYDFTHCISDATEKITHSLCTLEFEDHRPLYDWYLETLNTPYRPRQIEFARLNVNHMITSKRKLNLLVTEGHVSGWDDPRMPTLKGMRRRGYTPKSIIKFCESIGVTKKNTDIEFSQLEQFLREDLNESSSRAMAVLDPLKVTITNFEGTQTLKAPNTPQLESTDYREMPFSNEIYIEREDFLEDAPKKFFRLAPNKEVRLRYSYILKCEEVIKDTSGEIIELKATIDHDTLGKKPDRKVKGIIHWVCAQKNFKAPVRIYDRLFDHPKPGSAVNFLDHINIDSVHIIENAILENSLEKSVPGECFQFERLGYFTHDKEHGFHRTVTLKDTWAKINKN